MREPSERIVWVTDTFVAFHGWPEAPPDVGYLRSAHRHRFHVRVDVRVLHGDRDAEFHQVQRRLRGLLYRLDGSDLGARSCEMLADEIADHVAEVYEVAAVTVSEDNENGATLRWA